MKRPNDVFWHGLSGAPCDIELNVCDYYWKNKRGSTGQNAAYYQLSSTTANKLNFRPYAGAKKLNEFKMKANFYWHSPYGMRKIPYNFQISS